MASVTQNCIFKSVVLGNGETFVLPPGAILLGATDSSLISSSCLDQVIPDTELLCYHITWVLNLDPEGARTVHLAVGFPSPAAGPITIPEAVNAWEDDDGAGTPITIDKISIGGIIFSAGVNCRDFGALEASLAGSSAGSALLDRKYIKTEHIEPLTAGESAAWGGQSQFRTGYITFEFFFKTLDDIAPDVYFEFGGGQGNISSLTRIYPVVLDCADYPTTTDITC